MIRTSLALAIFAATATAAFAGPIESACLRSNRDAASPALCGCIGNLADQLLTGFDQRRAAGFFSNPAKAQEVRQSDRASDVAFWLRYKGFGDTAETYCAAG